MREWRKVYSAVISSDKLAKVSDAAAWLYTLLLVAQDDAGCYPWTPAKIRSLCVNRSWSGAKTAKLLKELVQNALVETHGDALHIIEGEAKNGKPYTWRDTFYYDETPAHLRSKRPSRTDHVGQPPSANAAHPVATALQHGSNGVATALQLDQRRGEESREDTPPTPSPAGTPSGVCVREGPFGDILDDELGERYEDGPSPRPFVLPPQVPKTAREAHFAAFRKAYLSSPGGTEWNWVEARKAWLEAVPPGEEEACLAKLALYAATDQVRRGYVKAPATWLPGWRDQQKPAPALVRPGDKDADGKLRLAV